MFFRKQTQQPPPGPKTLQDYANTVETILVKLNIDPKQAKIAGADNVFGWTFQWGSATIEVWVKEHDGHGYFQVLSPIMYLPASGLLQLYRRLLELNLQLTNASVGVYFDVIYIFSERRVEGLESVEADQIITSISAYADELDNQLVNEFGGRLFSQP